MPLLCVFATHIRACRTSRPYMFLLTDFTCLLTAAYLSAINMFTDKKYATMLGNTNICDLFASLKCDRGGYFHIFPFALHVLQPSSLSTNKRSISSWSTTPVRGDCTVSMNRVSDWEFFMRVLFQMQHSRDVFPFYCLISLCVIQFCGFTTQKLRFRKQPEQKARNVSCSSNPSCDMFGMLDGSFSSSL